MLSFCILPYKLCGYLYTTLCMLIKVFSISFMYGFWASIDFWEMFFLLYPTYRCFNLSADLVCCNMWRVSTWDRQGLISIFTRSSFSYLKLSSYVICSDLRTLLCFNGNTYSYLAMNSFIFYIRLLSFIFSIIYCFIDLLILPSSVLLLKVLNW